MTYISFVTAVFVLLLTPGPTNTLMALASAQNGFWRVPRLLPAELGGYLTTILPSTLLGGELMRRWPEAAIMLKVGAAAWVMYLAVTLWTAAYNAIPGRGSVTASRVYVTTMLNPKALVVGLVLLPASPLSEFFIKLAVFGLLASAVALIWGGIGRLAEIGAEGDRRLVAIQRAASIWLAIVSAMLIAGLFRS